MRAFAQIAGLLLALIGATASGVQGQGNTQTTTEGFVLSGVVFFDGGSGFAWLQEPSLTNNRVVAVRSGQSVGPYRLTGVFEDRVELEGPTGKVLVPLHKVQGVPVPAIASAVPAAVPAAAPPPIQEARAPQPPRASPFANNPGVRYFPPGDPSRSQGFGELFGLGMAAKSGRGGR